MKKIKNGLRESVDCCLLHSALGKNAAIGSSCSQISQGSRTQNWEVSLLKTALGPDVGLSQ